MSALANICTVKANELDELQPVFLRFFNESGYPGTFSMDSMRRTWEPLLVQRKGEMLLSLSDTGDVQGLVAMIFSPDQFNGEPTAILMLWYVTPEGRGKGLGQELLNLAEQTAQARNCVALVHGHRFAVTKGSCKRLLEERGYVLEELGFRKVL